ncbi:MAG: DUF4886 domain-containing protein [Alistipes sp.]|nr:DUF4886 domain-containing protein [Candidatus Alistipes equi]
MKKILFCCVMAIAMSVVACSAVDIDNVALSQDTKTVSIRVSISDETRTSFDGVSKVVWEKGDQIAVASPQEGAKVSILTTEQGGENAVFTGEIPVDLKAGRAFYPASVVKGVTKTGFSFTQPSSFVGIAGSIAQDGVPMTAEFDDISNGISFRHFSALVSVSVGGKNIKSVTLDLASGTDAGYISADEYNVDCKTLVPSTKLGSTVSKFTANSGETLAPGKYFFCVPVGDTKRTFEGLKVTYETNEGVRTIHKSSNPLTVNRGYLYTIPGTEADCTETVPSSVRVLCIGNSFSADLVEQELYGLFAAENIEVVIGDMYIGGCPLEKHATNTKSDNAAYSYRKIVNGNLTKTSDVKLSTALKDEQWDFISVQEGAGYHGYYNRTYTTKQMSIVTHSMEPDLTTLINYCKEKSANKDFKLVYHAPWVAQKGYTGTKFSYYSYDQQVMYDMICEATQQVLAAHPEIDVYINTMDGIQNGRSSYIGDNFTRDGWHLSYTRGRYLAGCLCFEKLTGVSCVGNKYHPSTISDYEALLCQTAAHEAVLHPYKVTDLSTRFEDQGGDDPQQRSTLAKWYFSPDRAISDGCVMTWTGQTEIGVYRYSLAPGERGYYLANEEGYGKLSYVQIDKTQWASRGDSAGLCIFSASNGGQPVMSAPMAGDYWLFETTGGYEFDEGTKLHMIYTYNPGSYGAKYWRLEYLDGSEWKPVEKYPLQEKTISGGEGNISYNLSFVNAQMQVDFDVVLENPTKEFKVRQVCCSSYQVNDKIFTYPNIKCVSRIAGDPNNIEKPLPQMWEVFD